MIRTFVACVVAILTVTAAMPAAAARYVFDVTVNLKTVDPSGAQFSVDPVTFRQSWITRPVPGAMSDINTTGIPGNNIVGYESSAPARHSRTPLDAEAFAVSGLAPSDLNPAQFQAADAVQFVNFVPDRARAVVNLVHFTQRSTAAEPGIELQQLYANFLRTPLGGPVDITPRVLRPIDARELGSLLEDIGTFEFVSGGYAATRDTTTNAFAYDGIAIYFGTAQYRADLSAVPEPQAWMLWIGGIALLGAGLRQRRLAPARLRA